jgi:hypothetical protein
MVFLAVVRSSLPILELESLFAIFVKYSSSDNRLFSANAHFIFDRSGYKKKPEYSSF